MRLLSLLIAILLTITSVMAQDAPLVVNPSKDQFLFYKKLYRQANATKDRERRNFAYQQLAPRLKDYISRFPNSPNTSAATYYLGECYYQSGFLQEARSVFLHLLQQNKKGRYQALAANRLGYDAFINKRYRKAATYFHQVATMATTPNERYRGRYQEASCYRYSHQDEKAIQAYLLIENALDAPSVYRQNAKLRLGYLFAANQQFEKALEKFADFNQPDIAAKLRTEAALNAGLISLKLEKLDDAEAYFKTVLLSNEKKFKARAQASLMNTLYAKKDYQGVFDVIKRGNYISKPSVEAIKYTIAGRSAYHLKRYHDAILYFSKAERQFPLSKEAFDAGYYRLLSFFGIEGSNIPKQVDAFLEVYRHKFPRSSKIHKALLMKAETLFDKGKLRAAAAAYNKINSELIGKDNRANLFFKRGWCLLELGDHNGAVRNFSQFITDYPDDKRVPQAIAQRGKSYLVLGNRSAAMKDFDLLIKRFPKNKLAALAWQNSAKIKKESQDYPDMIHRYQSMIDHFPNLRKETIANAYYWIGWGNYQLKNFNKAIPILKKSGELNPKAYGLNAKMLIVYCSYAMKNKSLLESAVNDILKEGKGDKVQPAIYRWLGVQCFNGGEMKKAEHYLSLGTTPDDPRQTPKAFWKMLGSARVQIGKNKEALVAIKNFLDVVEEPFWKAETLLDQAKAYLALKKLDEAKNSVETALKLRPKGSLKAELRLTLGDIAYAAKRYADAAASYVLVVEFAVNDKEIRPKALYKVSQALIKKGDKEQAKHYLEKLKIEFPHFKKSQ